RLLPAAARDPGVRGVGPAGRAGRGPGAGCQLADRVPAGGAGGHDLRERLAGPRRPHRRLLRLPGRAARGGRHREGAHMTWVNDILQGIFLGGAYALTAVGLSLMFGVMRMVNLAHGDLAVCGTYLATTVMAAFGVPLWIAMLIMVPLAFLLGLVLQLRLFGRALRSGTTAPLLLTFGLSVIIENLLLQTYSANTRG